MAATVIDLLVNIASSAKPIQTELKKATDSLKQFASDVASVAKTAAAGFAAFGVGVAGALGLAAKGAADTEQALAKVVSLLDKSDRTPAMIETLRSGAYDLARLYGVEVKDGIDAMYQAISSGIKPAEVIKFLGDSAIAAKAGVASLKDVVDLTTSVIATYGLTAADATAINDTLFTGVKVGKTEYSELSASLGLVLPVAKACGVGLDELVGSVAALTLSGFKTSEAVTAVRSALSNVLKPSDQATKMAEALGIQFDVTSLKAKGLQKFLAEIAAAASDHPLTKVLVKDLGDAQKEMGKLEDKVKSLQVALAKADTPKQKLHIQKQLEEANAKLSDFKGNWDALQAKVNSGDYGEASSALAQLFGDVQGLAGVLALGANEGKQFNDVMGEMAKKTGATQDAFAGIAMVDPTIPFTKLAAGLKELSDRIGEGVLQALAPLVEKLLQIVGAMVEWVRANPQVAVGIAKVGLALAGFALAAAGFLTLVAGLATALAGMMAVGFTPLLAISIPLLAFMAALAAGAYLVWTHLDEIKAWWAEHWPGIKAHLEKLWQDILPSLKGLLVDLAAAAESGWKVFERGLGILTQLAQKLGIAKDGWDLLAKSIEFTVKVLRNIIELWQANASILLGVSGWGGKGGPGLKDAERGGGLQQAASGGILRGPSSEYLAVLHGTELVSRMDSDGTIRARPQAAMAGGGPVTINLFQAPGQSSRQMANAVAEVIYRARGGTH